MRSILIAAASMAFMAAGPANPQTADVPAMPTLHAETRVVQIDVVVTDSHGKPLTDLTKSDFTVTDKGKARAIDIFSGIFTGNHGEGSPSFAPAATALPPNVFTNRNPGPPRVPPHTTVIVLDQLNVAHDSDRTPFQTAAGYQLQVTNLMSKISQDERIALYVAAKDEGLVLLQDYTTDRDLLITRLRSYIPRGMSSKPYQPAVSARAAALPGSPRRDPNDVPGRETQAQAEDASRDDRMSLQALAEHLALVPGRKNVFLVRGQGPPLLMHGMNQMAWDKTVDALNEANVAVNTVGELADRTGGQSWGMRYDLDAAMAEEIDASRTTYTLGFYLADTERDNEFHALTVQSSRPGLQLFYRRGYYAGDSELPAAYDKTSKGELESALLNQVDATGIGITARVETIPGTPRGKLDIRLTLDPATLSFREQPGGRVGNVEEMMVELDDNGQTLGKVIEKKEFELNGANVSVEWPLSIPLAEGVTRLTIVVRDSKSGHVGSLAVPLTPPASTAR